MPGKARHPDNGTASGALAAGPAADVVGKADEEEGQNERDPDNRDALVDLPTHRPAPYTLDYRESDVAAVERQQRQEIEQRQGEADEAQDPEEGLEPAVERARRSADDADRARDLLTPGTPDQAGEDAPDLLRDQAREPQRLPGGHVDRERFEVRTNPDSVAIVRVFERPDRRQVDAAAVPLDGDPNRLPVRVVDLLEHADVPDPFAVDRHDPVARPEASLLCRAARLNFGHGRRPTPWAGGEQEREHQDREDKVRSRAGADHEDLLPRRLTPVGVSPEAIAELCEATLHALARRLGELSLLRGTLQRDQCANRELEIALVEEALEPLARRVELRHLLDCPAEVRVHVGRRRPVHSGNLHVTAERDRPDPVLDVVAAHLGNGGREADVELPRAHTHEPRRIEVAGLVNEHEEGETQDRDQRVHASAIPRSAIVLASASASISSSTSL